ncbi:hypothetical protein [Ensifer adhaerens]|uniref:hypothetical protein n=1 Tax=Ensifer adhaerens TaxID=106592 RepID=UPI001319C992|nr:hypothetical protein [Ensifer adhaerens]
MKVPPIIKTKMFVLGRVSSPQSDASGFRGESDLIKNERERTRKRKWNEKTEDIVDRNIHSALYAR